jgi:hypothetical protein
MIELSRVDDMAIRLLLDRDGVLVLRRSFSEAANLHQIAMQVRLDPRVTSKRCGPTTEIQVDVEMRPVSIPSLVKGGRGVQWILGQEDLESGLEQLERAETRGYFSPAEFLRVQIPNRRKLDWIYAELAT